MGEFDKILIRRDHAQDMIDAMKLMRKYANKGKVAITEINGSINESIIIAVEQALNELPLSAETTIFNLLQAAAKKAAKTGERKDLQAYLKLRAINHKVSITKFIKKD